MPIHQQPGMRYGIQLFLPLGLLMLLFLSSTLAVMSGDERPLAVPNDPDYTAGLAAFGSEDWQGVIDHMSKVVARRPWDDNAYNLLGFAMRKLGHYRRALAHYQQALDLNPYHRGALEYLGETYLEMGCITQAQEVLTRLEAACKRIMDDRARDRWQAGCQEWQDLHAALATARPPAPPGCTLE